MSRQSEFVRRWVERDGHRYEADMKQQIDRIPNARPCRVCGRFPGSFLHQQHPEGDTNGE